MPRYLLLLVVLLAPRALQAATITVTPSDSYAKIEAAVAGDTVLIAPGTYKFRVLLDHDGTATKPIVIRAQDPANRPVWDLGGKVVSRWPGSYTAGDKGRGCWQVSGSHYVIEGIVFRNCQDTSSSGLRAINSSALTVRDCLFEHSTNGITGSAEGFVVEFCEFHDNGKLTTTGNPSHNVYIFGGTFSLRYSYLHHPLEGQNLHIRARQAEIEYNWLSGAASYPADLMSCETLCGGSGSAAITQKMTLRGNIIVQDGGQTNLSQFIAMYNDEPGGSNDSSGAVSSMELTLIHNTVVGVPMAAGMTQRLVNMRNDGVVTKVVMHNNIVYQVKELAVPYEASKTNWSRSGHNNWVSTGTPTTDLTGSVVGSSPGFVDASARNLRLTTQSPCVGKAAAVAGLPTKEYYLDETVTQQYRPRATAQDIGAYEQGNTAAPVGPHGAAPTPDGGVPTDGGSTQDGPGPATDGLAPALDGTPTGDGAAVHDAAGDGAAQSDDDGCGCVVGDSPRSAPLLLLLLLGLTTLRAWNNRRTM